MQLIDKTVVIAEIEKRMNKYATIDVGNSGELDALYGAKCHALKSILTFINTLEVKDAEEKFEKPSIKIEDSECVDSRMKYINEGLKPIAKFILEYVHWNLHKDEWNHPVLEVPLFRVLDALIQRGKPYNETCKDCETECPNFDEAQGTSFVK